VSYLLYFSYYILKYIIDELENRNSQMEPGRSTRSRTKRTDDNSQLDDLTTTPKETSNTRAEEGKHGKIN